MKNMLFAFLCIFAITPVMANWQITYDDGLPTEPNQTTYADATDRNGNKYGYYKYQTFFLDTNGDDIPDKIIRGRYTSPTGAYTFYKIELQDENRQYTSVKLPTLNFRTIENGDCFFTIFRFYFDPDFQVHKISREISSDCIAATPTMVEVYKLSDDEFYTSEKFGLLPSRDVRLAN